MHEITLTGYTAACSTATGRCLNFGTRGSYGCEKIRIIPGEGWEDMMISLTFHPPGMEPVRIILDDTRELDVPPEATAVVATEFMPGKIVFAGARDGANIISADLHYLVENHAPISGRGSTPTPNEWEQIASAYNSKLDKQQGTENAGKVLSVGEDGNVTYSDKMEKANPVGVGAFSMNRKADTVAGGYSTTLGFSNTASGAASHAEGYNTIAAGTRQHVQGQYNIADTDSKYLHIVGNGKSDSTRSNAHTLDRNGLGWFKGGLKVGGTSQDDAEAKEVATKEDKLPNPNALTFTGAVEGMYDGSAPMEVEIPEGGSEWKTAHDFTVEEDVSMLELSGFNCTEFVVCLKARCNHADNSLNTGSSNIMVYVNEPIEKNRICYPSIYARTNDTYSVYVHGQIFGGKVYCKLTAPFTGDVYTHASTINMAAPVVEATEITAIHMKFYDTKYFLKPGSKVGVYFR